MKFLSLFIAFLIWGVHLGFQIPVLSAAETGLDQYEADRLEQQLVPVEVLKTIESFEENSDYGVPVEITQDYISREKLSLIFELFRVAQKENYVLRQENIEKLVIGSIFSATRTESTFSIKGVDFRQLRLIVDARAEQSEIIDFFENPFSSRWRVKATEELDEDIEELDGFYVSLMGSLGSPRALNFTREYPYGEPVKGRLLGSAGPDSRFSQYNFLYYIDNVEGGELVSLDSRTGEFEVEVPPDFYGKVEVNYHVTLFGDKSPTATMTLWIEPPLMTVAETFDLRSGRPVDILYVVDNSSGTEKQQAALGESFVRFISAFGEFNKKIRVAAIATSSTTAWEGQLLQLPSGETIISSADPRFVEKVQQLIQPGAERERRQSAILPTNNFFASSRGSEFLRDGAFFSMIIISQKDDDYLKTGDPERIMNVYRHTMSVMKDPEDMRIDAVVKYGTKTWLGGTSKQGRVYARLAEEFGGRVIDITKDFTRDLIEIGSEISRRAQESFTLSEPPYEGAIETMRIFVDEELIIRDPSNGWTYDPQFNRIKLHGEALDKSFGKIVKIYYSTIDRGRFEVTYE